MPAAIALAKAWHRIALLDASFAVPVAFVFGVLGAGMARRAKRNLAWLGLDPRGTGVASVGVILGVLAVSLAIMGAVSIGLYEATNHHLLNLHFRLHR
jgi:hypothetical protein